MKKLLIFWFAFLIFIIGPSLVCSVSEAQKKAEEINALLKEEKAIVSDIPGTTRDIIEDTLILDGLKFRFIDTAGLRKSNNKIEFPSILKLEINLI